MMQKAVIVDFDGTLVKINSFEKFFKQLFKYWIMNLKIGYSLYLLFLILIRKMKLIEHAELKKRTLQYVQNKDIKIFIEQFSKKLISDVNANVVEIIQNYRNEGYAIHLCTAAPKLYIEKFTSYFSFKFDEIVCTDSPTEEMDWKENLGEHKLYSTNILLHKRSEKLMVLLTDSYDDIPLLKIHKLKNIIVNPSEKTIKLLKKENIPFELI